MQENIFFFFLHQKINIQYFFMNKMHNLQKWLRHSTHLPHSYDRLLVFSILILNFLLQ